MTTSTNTLRLSPHLARDFAALDTRSRFLLSKSKYAAGASVAAAVGAAAAYGWAYAVQPSMVLSSVHVPPELLQMFSNAANVEMGGHPVESAMGRISGALTSVLPKGIAVLFFGLGTVATLYTGRLSYAAVALLSTVPLLAVPWTFGMVTSADQDSDRAAIVRFAKNADREALANMLAKVEVTPAERDYVLAQAAVAQAQGREAISGDALKKLRQQVAAVHYALANGSKMTFDGASVYALDVVATGQARATIAQRYYAEATQAAQSKRSTASALLASALLIGGAGAGLAFVARGMRRRVERIRPLIASGGEAASSEAKPAESIATQAQRAPGYGSVHPDKQLVRADDTQTDGGSSPASSLAGIAAVGLGVALVSDALSNSREANETRTTSDDGPRASDACSDRSDNTSDGSSCDTSDGGGNDGSD